MAAETELESMLVRLKGDGSGYLEMLNRAQEATKSFVSKVTSALEALGVERFLHSSMEAFASKETGIIRLNAVLQGHGRDVQALTEDYKKFSRQVAESSMTTAGEALQLLKTAGSYGLYGDAAKQAVENAIHFGEATENDAASVMRVSVMLAKGQTQLAMHMARHMAPQLREAKTPEEFAAKFKELTEQGMLVSEARSKSLEGAIHHLSAAWKSLKAELGATVAEGVKPVIKFLTDFVEWIKTAEPETKRMVVNVMMLGAALLAAGPAFSVFKVMLGPLGAVITLVKSLGLTLLSALLSPLGLVAAAAVAGAVVWAKYTESGRQTVSSFKEFWTNIGKDAMKGVQGVKDAIAAGNIGLAFEIAFVQAKVSLLKALEPIRVVWIEFVEFLKMSFANASLDISTNWNDTIRDMVLFVDKNFRDFFNIFRSKEGKEWDQFMQDEVRRFEATERELRHKRAQADHDAAIAAAIGGRDAALENAKKQLEELEKKRNALVGQAGAAAAEVRKKAGEVGGISGPASGAAPSVEAVAFRSAEAASRIAASMALVAGKQDVAERQDEKLGDIRDVLRKRLPENPLGLEAANV